MTKGFSRRSYNNRVIIVLLSVWLTYYCCGVGSLEVNKTRFQCVESERDALLHFIKHGIRVDHCGFLDAWGHTEDCCQWRGIRCDNQSGHVIGLKLRGSGSYFNDEIIPCFEGTLSVAILNLTHLKYLDLSANNFSGQLPKFLGSLASLERLNLSYAGFSGVIPQEIGNLSQLTSLDLSVLDSFIINIRVDSLGWLSGMRLLREVDLSGINLNATKNTWLSVVNNLPVLRVLRLDGCGLNIHLPSSLSYINSSTILAVLSLSWNNFNDTSIFEWLFNLSELETNLIYLDLGGNEMMFENNLQKSGRAMNFVTNLCSLQVLGLSRTNLNYNFSKIVESFHACPHKSLVSLILSFNKIWGSIPDNIGAFSFLRELYVNDNMLKGIITQALGKLSMLETLDLSSNSFNGTLSSVHLTNLSQLRSLILSGNTELEINIKANWIPPFQLDNRLYLRSCKVGPSFPKWILSQKNLLYIDISNCSISDTIPTSFWNSSFMSTVQSLDMSHNMIYGTLPDIPIIFRSLHDLIIDLSFNNLEGEIPPFLMNNVSDLLLSNNNFSKGLLAFLCPHTQSSLVSLDLSSNLFSEKFPNCWSYFDKLEYLNLENNSLWGSLPTTIGTLGQLTNLHLSNNDLSGELPTYLKNCTSLKSLHLANNLLVGEIPVALGIVSEIL